VSQQELDLFEIPTAFPAEFGAGPAKVMGSEVLDSDLPGRLLHHRPHRPVTQARSHLAAFRDTPQESPLFDVGGRHPGIDALFDPERDGDRSDAPSLAFEVSQHPAVFPELDG
jgi:hypothetical protein